MPQDDVCRGSECSYSYSSISSSGFWILDGGFWVLGSHSDSSKPKRQATVQTVPRVAVLLFRCSSLQLDAKCNRAKTTASQPASQPGNMSQTRGLELKKVESLDDDDDDGGSYDSTPNTPHSLGARCTCVCTVSWPKSAFGGPASWPATPSPSQAVANYALRLNCLEPLETG